MPERTPEQIGREAGEAIANVIADNLEAVIVRLAEAVAKVQAEQGEIRDALVTVTQRLDRHHKWLVSLDELTARR